MAEINIENFESVSLGAPRLDPGGPYEGQITDTPEVKTSDSGKSYLEVKTRVLEGPEQQEPDPETDSHSPAGREFTDRYYLNERAAFRLKRLLVATGLLAKDDKDSPMAKGQFNSDMLAGQKYKFQVSTQMNNGKEYRNYDPIV